MKWNVSLVIFLIYKHSIQTQTALSERFKYFQKFLTISEENYSLLTDKLKTKRFNKGDFLVQPGQVQDRIYFVQSGVQMSYFESKLKTHVIAFTYYPNLSAIPESFNLQKPSKYFLVCLTESELEYITYDDLQKIYNISPAIERLFRRFSETLHAGSINRHMELQSQSIQERYTAFCRRSPHLLQTVPHKYIASYLGIDPSNFSKLYNSVKFWFTLHKSWSTPSSPRRSWISFVDSQKELIHDNATHFLHSHYFSTRFYLR